MAGRSLGDELVCEDAVATYDRFVFPPENVKQFLTVGRRNLSHLESTSCPGWPTWAHLRDALYNQPLAKTIGIMSRRVSTI